MYLFYTYKRKEKLHSFFFTHFDVKKRYKNIVIIYKITLKI